jgi:hypothetical protein
LFHVERLTRLWKNSRDSRVIDQLFHVEQSPVRHTFCRSADKEARGSATLVCARSRAIKVGRFVPRGTQTASFRLKLGASDPRERGYCGEGTKKDRDFRGDS